MIQRKSIDFIDLNYNTTSDIGSGGGMPGKLYANYDEKFKKRNEIYNYMKKVIIKAIFKRSFKGIEIRYGSNSE